MRAFQNFKPTAHFEVAMWTSPSSVSTTRLPSFRAVSQAVLPRWVSPHMSARVHRTHRVLQILQAASQDILSCTSHKDRGPRPLPPLRPVPPHPLPEPLRRYRRLDRRPLVDASNQGGGWCGRR